MKPTLIYSAIILAAGLTTQIFIVGQNEKNQQLFHKELVQQFGSENNGQLQNHEALAIQIVPEKSPF